MCVCIYIKKVESFLEFYINSIYAIFSWSSLILMFLNRGDQILPDFIF